MTEDANIQALRESMKATERAYDRHKSEVRAKADAARRAILDEGAPEIERLGRLKTDAQRALEVAISGAASHPWDGKRVSRTRTTGSSWGPKKTETIHGLVRVRRAGERVGAGNQTWGLPEIGQAYILAVKKDGSPALRVLANARPDGTFFENWVVEGAKP